MSWNYRVVKETSRYLDVKENLFTIKEAFYDKEGNFNGMTENPATVSSIEGIKGLRYMLTRMLESLERPVIEEKK